MLMQSTEGGQGVAQVSNPKAKEPEVVAEWAMSVGELQAFCGVLGERFSQTLPHECVWLTFTRIGLHASLDLEQASDPLRMGVAQSFVEQLLERWAAIKVIELRMKLRELLGTRIRSDIPKTQPVRVIVQMDDVGRCSWGAAAHGETLVCTPLARFA